MFETDYTELSLMTTELENTCRHVTLVLFVVIYVPKHNRIVKASTITVLNLTLSVAKETRCDCIECY
jgi:hypothetical protein